MYKPKLHPVGTTFLDLARIFGALAVVCIHTIGTVNISGGMQSFGWWISNLVITASIWAVPLFVMISGALLLTKVGKTAEFYRKRFISVGVPTIFWICFYFIFNHFTRGDSLALSEFLRKIIFGGVGHLYFLPMILELYLLTPFFKAILSKLSQTEVAFLIGLFFFIAAFWGLSRFSITLFVPYIGYYFAGMWLHTFKLPTKYQQYLSVAWLLCALAVLSTVILGKYLDIESYYYFTHGNPLIICFSVVTFLVFKYSALTRQSLQLFSAGQIQAFVSHTLMIYLIHPAVLTLVTLFLLRNSPVQWYSGLLLIPLIFFASYLLSKLFATISACLQKKFSWLRWA